MRSLPVAQLIPILIEEHRAIKDGLQTVEAAATEGDFVLAKRALSEVDTVFRQHIADEEGQILKLLLETYGKEASGDAIRLFRQHRPIYELMKTISNLANLSPEVLSKNQNDLKRLLKAHTLAEERWLFPRANEADSNRRLLRERQS